MSHLLQVITPFLDIIFTLLVCFVCAKALKRVDILDSQKQAQAKSDIENLQVVLRELLEEAAAASRNLDNSLCRRKQELEQILQKTNEAKKDLGILLQNAESKQSLELNYGVEAQSELPNSTWKNASQAQKAVENLSRKIEVSRSLSHEKNSRSEDTALYRVAMRLLEGGMEASIIAKKLELPIAEVQLLAKSAQIQAERAIPEQPKKQLSSERKNLTEENNLFRSTMQQENFDHEIERELTLF